MSDSSPPSDPKRRRLEGVIPELIKRAVELGVEKASEAPDNLKELMGGMKVPKEIAGLLLAQMDETKNGLFRVVAKEIRDFLEHTNMAGEMQKMLTTVQFEISTTIRFKPNDEGKAEGDAETEGETEEKRGSRGAKAPGEPGTPRRLSKPEVKTEVQMTREPRPPRERRRSRD
jgi:hypothetical protein